jgi:GNAT superfamily N-acetyltransferase
MPGFQLRPWHEGDSLAALTTLLHQAYAPLGAAGMNFTAVTQTEAVTAARVRGGHCLLAERDGQPLGTVTVNRAFDPNTQAWARATPWFYRDDVAHLHQYAVAPAAQGQGVGTALLAAAEAWAQQQGCAGMALDTALPAQHLRQRYAAAGYQVVDEVQWAGKTYRSVVMLKPLAPAAPLAATDTAHHAALVRCLWACFQARDWAAARALLADDAQLHWLASGEWLLDADAIVRVQAIYPEGWTIHVREVTPMADGRVHSLVQVDHGEATFHAHTLWRFAGALIAGGVETWATAEAPPAWRTAEAIGAYRRGPWRAGL